MVQGGLKGKSIACASVGLACPWVLMRFSVFFTLLEPRLSDAATTDTYVNQCFAIFMVFIFVTCIAVVLYRVQFVKAVLSSRHGMLFMGLCSSIGFCLINAFALMGSLSEIALGVGVFMAAVFACLLLVVWGARILSEPLRVCSIQLAMGICLTCVLLGAAALSSEFLRVFSVVAPCCAGVVYVMAGSGEPAVDGGFGVLEIKQLDWRVLIPVVALLGLSSVFNKLISSTSSALINNESRLLTDVFAILLFGALLLYRWRSRESKTSVPQLFIVSTSVMMLGLLLIVLELPYAETVGGAILMTSFYCYVYVLLVQLAISHERTGASPIALMALFVIGAVVIPLLLSNTIVYEYASFLQSSNAAYATTFAAMLSFLVAVVVFALLGSQIQKRTPKGETEEERRKRLCAAIAEEYGLSAREEEVLLLLYAGRSRKKISEILVVSPSTTQGHISHVYQKIGIHKRDELIDFVNDREG